MVKIVTKEIKNRRKSKNKESVKKHILENKITEQG